MNVCASYYVKESNGPKPPHHGEKGFVNPYPGFKEHGFGDFLYWKLFDHSKKETVEKKDAPRFKAVENDGKAVRENRERFSVTWIGHSTFLVQIGGVNILTDPVWSDRCSPVGFMGPKRAVKPGLRFEDLPEIHAVIISHDHYDHLDRDTIKKLGGRPGYYVPLGVRAILAGWEITNAYELDWWDSCTHESLEIICVPAQHFSGRSVTGRNETLWCGWVVKGKARSFYFAGDTGYFPGFREIAEKLGPVDAAALPIGAYEPRWFMGPVHLNPGDAVQAYLDLRASKLIATHWGTFNLAWEPMDEPPQALRKEVHARSLDGENFIVLKHGETKFMN